MEKIFLRPNYTLGLITGLGQSIICRPTIIIEDIIFSEAKLMLFEEAQQKRTKANKNAKKQGLQRKWNKMGHISLLKYNMGFDDDIL